MSSSTPSSARYSGAPSSSQFSSLAVFCGSNPGTDPAFRQHAIHLGEVMVEQGLDLIYGGGKVGLMGVIADTVLAGGGRVVGVIPRLLFDLEVGHRGLSELILVDSMHERKRLIYERSSAVIAMPGGTGTLDELFEAFTWNQLRIHHLPCGLLNVDGYWDPLIAMLDRQVEKRFLRAEQRQLLIDEPGADRLIERLRQIPPPDDEGKWLDRVPEP